MKYRKKPVIVDAIQWTGENEKEVESFLVLGGAWFDKDSNFLIICTLEGDMYVDKGDYIIRGIKGEFYSCKPDIFEETYETL